MTRRGYQPFNTFDMNYSPDKYSTSHAYPPAYEISEEDLQISTPLLGSGEFVTVLKGTYKNVDVAVKRARPDLDRMKSFLSTLREIKLMAYIGKHPHIVEFVGTTLGKIKNGSVDIVLEFCHLGDLQTYLKSNRTIFHSSLRSSTESEIDDLNKHSPRNDTEIPAEDVYIVTPDTLTLWCEQIADAMTYLAHKNVVHGDLAPRNILLSTPEMAKVADFGLSQWISPYAMYTKQEMNVVIPWRSCSLETLTFMTFSLKSDVWGFGVMAWEIFNLCKRMPYPGFGFGSDFIRSLENGLRLDQPEFCPPEIFEFLLRCWDADPDNRPTADEIKTFFSH